MTPTLRAHSALSTRRQRLHATGRYNAEREYTRGASSSFFPGVLSPDALTKLHGSVDDIDLKLGWDAKEQMDTDPICSAALDTRVMGATARKVEVEPAEAALYQSDDDARMAHEIAAFVRRCLKYLAASQRDLNLTAYQLGREALKIGHSKAEVVKRHMKFGPDAGRLVIDRIKSKTRHNSCFLVDPQGNVTKIAAYTGDYSNYTNPYDLAGMGLVGAIDFNELQQHGWEALDRDKWLVITNRPPADDSPLGHSLYRPVYTDFRCKRDVLPMYLTSLDNTSLPHTVVTMPEQRYAGPVYPLGPNGQEDKTKEKIPLATALLHATEVGRRAGVTILPYSATAQYLHAATSGDPHIAAFGFFSSRITMGILMQTLATGTSKHMARAAGEVHQDILDLAMRHDRRMISDSITRDVFTPLVHDNFHERWWHLVPSCSFGEVELNDFAAWADAFANLADAGLVLPSQFAHIHAVLGMPQADEDELDEMIDVDAAINAKLREPEVKADGSVGPSQQEKYIVQEYGKNLTRKQGRRRAGRNGATIAG